MDGCSPSDRFGAALLQYFVRSEAAGERALEDVVAWLFD